MQAVATVAAAPIVAAASGLNQITAPASQSVSTLESTSGGSIDATNTVVLGGVAMSAIAFMGLFSMADYLVSGGILTPLRRKDNRKRMDPGIIPSGRGRGRDVQGKIR